MMPHGFLIDRFPTPSQFVHHSHLRDKFDNQTKRCSARTGYDGSASAKSLLNQRYDDMSADEQYDARMYAGYPDDGKNHDYYWLYNQDDGNHNFVFTQR